MQHESKYQSSQVIFPSAELEPAGGRPEPFFDQAPAARTVFPGATSLALHASKSPSAISFLAIADSLRSSNLQDGGWRGAESVSRTRAETARKSGALLGDATIPRLGMPSPLEKSISTQKWEGYVTSIDRTLGTFHARLVDVKGIHPDYSAEFSLEELSADDRPLLKPGAVFYWSIGYRDLLSGTRFRESILRMRRLPAITDEEEQEARTRAERLLKKLGWDDLDEADRAGGR